MEDPGHELGDETVKIFLTPEGKADDVSEEVKSFMAYMTKQKTESDFAKRLDDAVKAIKSGEGWRIEYMQLKEKMDANFAAGEKKGRSEGLEIGIRALIESDKIDGIPEEKTIDKLVTYYNISEYDAKKKIEEYETRGRFSVS